MTVFTRAHPASLPTAAFFWTLLLAGCDREPTAGPGSEGTLAREPVVELAHSGSRRADGRVFDDDDFRLEVGAPRVCNETAPFLPEPGSMRLSIPVVVRAKTRRLIPISPLSFQLTDRQGRKYGPTLAGCRPALNNVRLGEGQSAEGDVAFDVAVGAQDLELGFDPFVIGRTDGRALVRVPSQPVDPEDDPPARAP